jgi:hypothetical protein
MESVHWKYLFQVSYESLLGEAVKWFKKGILRADLWLDHENLRPGKFV